MPEGDLRGSLMRLNSPNQFPASSGYFMCQDMTTKADDTPRPERGTLACSGRRGRRNRHLRIAPGLSWGCSSVQTQCLSSIDQRCFRHQLPQTGQQVVSNCGFGWIKMIREPRLKDDWRTNNKKRNYIQKKTPSLIKGPFVPKTLQKSSIMTF